MKGEAKQEFANLVGEYLGKKDLYSIKMKTNMATMIMNVRYAKKMNQSEFAAFMGVTQGMVSKWESGEYNFSVEAIAEICAKIALIPALEFKSENEYKKEYIKSSNMNFDWGKSVATNNPEAFLAA